LVIFFLFRKREDWWSALSGKSASLARVRPKKIQKENDIALKNKYKILIDM
jgi:hypothetical protein